MSLFWAGGHHCLGLRHSGDGAQTENALGPRPEPRILQRRKVLVFTRWSG